MCRHRGKVIIKGCFILSAISFLFPYLNTSSVYLRRIKITHLHSKLEHILRSILQSDMIWFTSLGASRIPAGAVRGPRGGRRAGRGAPQGLPQRLCRQPLGDALGSGPQSARDRICLHTAFRGLKQQRSEAGSTRG